MKSIRAIIFSLAIVLTVFFLSGSQVSFAQTDTDTPTPTPTDSPTPTPTPTQVPGTTATPTPTCTATSAPTGLSAVSSGPTQIVLTWTAPSGNVDHYLLSYGTATGNYIYGNPSIGGTLTTYTVSSLSKGITYYFAMKAANSCSTSNFSSEVSATAGDTPSGTPSPSPETIQNPQEQAQPQTYQAANEQAVPQQAVQGAQNQQQGGFVSIPTYTPTPTESPISNTVNVVSYTGAAVIIFIVCASLFYWLQSRQKEKPQSLQSSHEKVEF